MANRSAETEKASARATLEALNKELEALESERRLGKALGMDMDGDQEARPHELASFRVRSRRLTFAGSLKPSDLESGIRSTDADESQLHDALAEVTHARRGRVTSVAFDVSSAASSPRSLSAASPRAGMQKSLSTSRIRRQSSAANLSVRSLSNLMRMDSTRSLKTGGNAEAAKLGYLGDHDTEVATRLVEQIENVDYKLDELSGAHRELHALLTVNVVGDDEELVGGPNVVDRLKVAVERHKSERRFARTGHAAAADDDDESRSVIAMAERAKARIAEAEAQRLADEQRREAEEAAYQQMRRDLRAEVLVEVFGNAEHAAPPERVVSQVDVHVNDFDCLSGLDVTIDAVLADPRGGSLFERLVQREREVADADDENARQKKDAADRAAEYEELAARVQAQRAPIEARKAEERRLAVEIADGVDDDDDESSPPPRVTRRSSSPDEDLARPPRRRPPQDPTLLRANEELVELSNIQASVDALREERQAQLETAVERRRTYAASSGSAMSALLQRSSPAVPAQQQQRSSARGSERNDNARNAATGPPSSAASVASHSRPSSSSTVDRTASGGPLVAIQRKAPSATASPRVATPSAQAKTSPVVAAVAVSVDRQRWRCPRLPPLEKKEGSTAAGPSSPPLAEVSSPTAQQQQYHRPSAGRPASQMERPKTSPRALSAPAPRDALADHAAQQRIVEQLIRQLPPERRAEVTAAWAEPPASHARRDTQRHGSVMSTFDEGDKTVGSRMGATMPPDASFSLR